MVTLNCQANSSPNQAEPTFGPFGIQKTQYGPPVSFVELDESVPSGVAFALAPTSRNYFVPTCVGER